MAGDHSLMTQYLRHFLSLIALVVGTMARGDILHADGAGRVRAMTVDGELRPIFTDLRLSGFGSAGQATMGFPDVRSVVFSERPGSRQWSGDIQVGDASIAHYEQTIRETPEGRATLTMRLTAHIPRAFDKAYWTFAFPIEPLRGAPFTLTNDGLTQTGDLPAPKPDHAFIAGGRAKEVSIGGPRNGERIRLKFPKAYDVGLRDMRNSNADACEIAVTFPSTESTVTEVIVTISVSEPADHTPVAVVIHPDLPLYTFGGFGGNYCFRLQSPLTDYTLDTLDVRWGRLEMRLLDWLSEKAATTSITDLTSRIAENDQPNTDFRVSMSTAQRMKRSGARLVISIWRLPGFLRGVRAEPPSLGWRLSEEKWPYLEAAIVSYLLYMKERYEVEPALFSFNEPNDGVYLQLTSAQQREIVLALGRNFERAGLRTKMLLGDVGDPHRGRGYVEETLRDAEAMQYVGALAFHSWGRPDADDYGYWRQTASRAGLPLLVTEVGVDPLYQLINGRLSSFYYALAELGMFQELLLHAWPTALLEWELTGDYPLGYVNASGTVTPYKRYWFLKQLTEFTPPGCQVLSVTGSQGKSMITANVDRTGSVSINIANIGARRRVTISGISPRIAQLSILRTTETESLKTMPAVRVTHGKTVVDVPALALVTLTNRAMGPRGRSKIVPLRAQP